MNVAIKEQEQEQETLLTSQEAHALLDTLTRTSTEDYEFYNRIRSGLLAVHSRTESGRMLFTRQSVEEAATLLTQHGDAPRATFTTQEAITYLANAGYPLKRSTFHARARELEEQGLIKIYSAPSHPKRPLYLFTKEGLNVMTNVLSQERARARVLEEQGLMTPRQASAYLSKKHGRRVAIDIVYSKIARGAIVPALEEKVGENKQYYLAKDDVDKLEIGPARIKLPAEREPRELVHITYLQDVKKLERKFKTHLLTKYGVLKLFHERTGKEYGEDALKQMHRRGTLEPIAVIGRTFLYLEKEAKAVHLLPSTGRRTHRTIPLEEEVEQEETDE